MPYLKKKPVSLLSYTFCKIMHQPGCIIHYKLKILAKIEIFSKKISDYIIMESQRHYLVLITPIRIKITVEPQDLATPLIRAPC